MEKTTDTVQILKKIWEKIFPDEKIDSESNFFELGGTSIKAVQLSSEFNKKTKITIDVASIYEYSNFSELAEYIEELKG